MDLSISNVITNELFTSYVRDCLSNLYDPGYLQTHPLAELLVSSAMPRATSAQCLRQIILDAIETLRPPDRVAFGQPQWQHYRLAWLRYVEGYSQEEVCRELQLGRTSFYRIHRQALDAIASIIREREQSRVESDTPGPLRQEQPDLIELAAEEADRAAQASHREVIDLDVLLASIQETILPLARQQGVDLKIGGPAHLPTTVADPAILRQIIVGILAEVISLSTTHAVEALIEADAQQMTWRLHGWAQGCHLTDLQERCGFTVSRQLLKSYHGCMGLDQEGDSDAVLTFTIPIVRSSAILVIDDNADALGLYRRYLQDEGYTLYMAETREQVQNALVQSTPDMVLLDVLMPEQDGWSILQHLRTTPETSHIPVVICSVLSQPDLALALGATAVLQKPFTQQDLLQAVQAVLAPPGTAGSMRPLSP